MPGDVYRRLLPGDPMPDSADLFNAMIDAAQAARVRDTGGGPITERPRATALVKVRNTTGSAVDRWGVLALGDPTILPADNADEFQRQIVFDGAAPTGSTPAGKFVVLTEPLPAGAIGLGVLAGVVTCKLSVPGSLGAFAECANANTTSLVTGSTGTARVLWAESSGTTRWAIVRLGDPAHGLAVREVDSAPSYTAATTFEFDQADGFVLSQPSPGVVRIDIAAATSSQAGVVSATTQTFGGAKTFLGNVSCGFDLAVAGRAFFANPLTYFAATTTVNAAMAIDVSTTAWTKLRLLDTTTGATTKQFAFTSTGRIVAQDGFGVGIAGSDTGGDTGTDAIGNGILGGLVINIQTSVANARANLGLGTAATASAGTFLAAANNLSDLASASTARSNLNLVPGTNIQAYSVVLDTLASLSPTSADRLPYFTGFASAALATLTSAARDLIDDPDAAAMRATLGLGSIATADAGDYLAVASNLADVASTSTARTNLAVPGLATTNTYTGTNKFENYLTVGVGPTGSGGYTQWYFWVSADTYGYAILEAFLSGEGPTPIKLNSIYGGAVCIANATPPSTNGNRTLSFEVVSSAPSGFTSPAIWAQTVSGTQELKAADGAGNVVQLTAHAMDGPAWLYDADDPMPNVTYEENVYIGYRRWTNRSRDVRLSRMRRLDPAGYARLKPEQLETIHEEWYEPVVEWDRVQADAVARRKAEVAHRKIEQRKYDQLTPEEKAKRPGRPPDLDDLAAKPMPQWLRDRLRLADKKRAELRDGGGRK